MATCWSCGAKVAESTFCPQCGKIQPVGARTHFELLGLPRQMNQDRPAIDRAFREASKKTHPDRLRPTNALERRLAVEHTARLNEAYRTIKDPQARAEYLLSLEGVNIGGETARTRDSALLMQMLEEQEAIDGAKDADTLETQRAGVVERRAALMGGLERYFDAGEGTQHDVSQALDELRYLRRLVDRIDAKLEEMT